MISYSCDICGAILPDGYQWNDDGTLKPSPYEQGKEPYTSLSGKHYCHTHKNEKE